MMSEEVDLKILKSRVDDLSKRLYRIEKQLHAVFKAWSWLNQYLRELKEE